MTPEIFASAPCLVAEGPRWHAAEKALYWVDITGGRVLRKNADSPVDACETFDPGLGKIGAFAFGADGRLVLFTERCEVHVAAFGGKAELKWSLPDHGDTRFNDVLDAGGGVFFCGVAPIRPDVRGELWRFDSAAGRFDCVEPATAGMPNGMGLSPDGRTFYFVVSDERRVYAYDFDSAARTISGRRVLCGDFAGDGVPDGMCVDPSDGSLWVAMWGGGRLERRAPDGRLLDSIPFSTEKVSSATVFGDRLYVSTANLPFDEAAFANEGAGCIFILRKDQNEKRRF